MKPIVVLVCLTAAVLALPAQAQGGTVRMYKCVDATGKVYYSDKLNPDCDQTVELNRQGVVIQRKEIAKPGQVSKGVPTLSPKEAKEQERRDRHLLASYTTEDEIDAARDRSLSVAVGGIQTSEAKLATANEQLNELKKQADALTAQKKPIPAQLQEEVKRSQRQIFGLEADLTQYKAQSDSIRAKYEADKKRFRELKSKGPQ